MELAWLGALCVGLSLGLLGSGGSILTVPVLVYVLGQDEKVAIAGSLAIVGAIALSGGLMFAYRGTVHWRSVLYFGVPGMAGTWLGAWTSKLVTGQTQLMVFAVVMLLAAGLMIKSPGTERPNHPQSAKRSRRVMGLEGLAVGVLTGFVGVGGGFLIVPALVLLGGLPMHLAIGTSLMIIALKSATGFLKYLEVLSDLGLQIDWEVLGVFTSIGIVGSVVGRKIGKRVPAAKLRRVFAVFLIVIGVAILFRNLDGAPSSKPADTEQQQLEGETLDG